MQRSATKLCHILSDMTGLLMAEKKSTCYVMYEGENMSQTVSVIVK